MSQNVAYDAFTNFFLPQHKIHREDYIGIVVGYIRTVFVKYSTREFSASLGNVSYFTGWRS